jgi:Fe-S-cluster-containing dehydrogenase component
VIALPLGGGRTSAGAVGDGVGSNAFKLATVSTHGPVYSGVSATIRRTNRVDKVSVIKGAGVVDVDYHRILATATLDEYKANPEAGIYRTPTTASVWEDHDFGELKWGMSIDMTRCTGCSACVIACQEENNIPVVGRQAILEGREMYWMRIDRYYELPEEAQEQRTLFGDPMYELEPHIAFGEYLDNPKVVVQPMLCQHCDRAPCETVCPVLATMQSNDGLNQMSYQACVGTRYCANNCPYKVRRYNWFNYTENRSESFFARLYPELKEHARLNATEPLQLAYNPDVTVRTRGVMEKCSFCVQRIRRAKWEIMKDGRRTFRDGEVVTACQQSCPAEAISFGNMLDEDHQVTQDKGLKRTMLALSDLNTQPAVSYMTRIRNTDEELA